MLAINHKAKIVELPVDVTAYLPELSGVVFICLDSMEVRRYVVDSIVAVDPEVSCIIETRMDAGVGISHCFNPQVARQLACWRLYWHSDDEAHNITGCGGVQSVISAIYGTSMLALKQFEEFARTGNTNTVHNRIYMDMMDFQMHSESWPSA